MALSPVLRELARHAPPGQVVRFLLVGLWNTAFAFAVYALLLWLLGTMIPTACFRAMVAGGLNTVLCTTVSFLGHKWFVFRTKGNLFKEYLRSYVVFGTISLGALAVLPALVGGIEFLLARKDLAPYIAGAIVQAGTVIASFFGHKQYTFVQQGTAEPESP